MNSKLAIAAVLSAVSVVFASVGPAHAEYGDTYTVDQSFREQSALMEGVDPEVWLMSDDQLIALGESESVLDNPARDLIADRVATESGLGGNGQGDSDRPSLNQDGLRQALSDLVEPAADIDTVRQVLSDPELAPVIDQGQKSVETLPTIEGQSGKVTLSHPAKSEYTISISPKDAAIVNTQKGVVESKNEHTGVLSVSQVTVVGVSAYAQAMNGMNLFAFLFSDPARLVGAGVWLTCLAIFGFAGVMIVGSVPIPLTLLIMNLSAVSPAALLAKTGFWVRFSPDLSAGGLLFPGAMRTNDLFTEATRTSLANDTLLNWTVIAGWVLIALGLAWLRVRRSEVAS